MTAGSENDAAAQTGQAENRYLFLTAEFKQQLLREPKRPASQSYLGKVDSLMTASEKQDKSLADAHQGRDHGGLSLCT